MKIAVLIWSRWVVTFPVDVPETTFCNVELTKANLKAFAYAVKNHYWYQAYIDDMPMWALVGDFGHGHQESADEKGADK